MKIMTANRYYGRGRDLMSGHNYYVEDEDKRTRTLLYKKAYDNFTEAIRLKPDFAAAYDRRAEAAAFLGGNYADNAIEDYTKAISLRPNHAATYWGRGWAYYEKGEYDKAISDFTEAIRILPKDWGGYWCRGKACRAKGDCDKAISDFREALKLDPENDDVAMALWSLLERR